MPFRWFVQASSAATGIVWIACSYILPNQASSGCIGAAMLIGINAVLQAHGGSGGAGAVLPTRDANGLLSMYHHADNVTYNFINTTALTNEWHNVSVPNHELDLIVRRRENGKVHLRTQGYHAMSCQDSSCPTEKRSPKFFKRDRQFAIYELDFDWTEPSGYGTVSQTDVEAAANGAAGYIAGAPASTRTFCSNAILDDGTSAEVSISFYSNGYVFADEPACGF
jgi:hypothetical protein